MHAHEVTRHKMVLPMDQNDSFQIKGKVADLGQHRVDLCEGSTNLTAGDIHNRAESAGEMAGHRWSLHGQHADPTVNGMIVSG